MEGETKQVDRQADSNGQVKNPRIIIDASYIRGMKKDGTPLHTICEQGGRIVLIDTLAYELVRSDDRNQWSATKRKLVACWNSIESWEHISQMCNVEIKKNCPYRDPVHDEKTKNLRKMLKENPDFQPDDLETLIEDYIQERESNSSLELLRNIADSQPFCEEEIKKIRNRNPNDKEVVQICYNLINDPENIRLAVENVVQNPDKLDHTWVLWHLSKSLLAVCCDRECRGEDKFKNISNEKLANIKHDLDYLVLLEYADAIASCETKGEQSYYRRWMFGDASKLLISSYEKKQIVHKFRQMSKLTIYVTEQLDGYTYALDPWSRGSLKIQDSETLPRSVFVSYDTQKPSENP